MRDEQGKSNAARYTRACGEALTDLPIRIVERPIAVDEQLIEHIATPLP